MEYTIDGCYHCPMRNEDREEGDHCKHPDQWGCTSFVLPYTNLTSFVLDSCPLKDETLTLVASFK